MLGIIILLLLLAVAAIARAADRFGGERSVLDVGEHAYVGRGEKATPRLVRLTRARERELQAIVSQADTMAAVGSGRPWPRAKTQKFLRYISQDDDSKPIHMYRGIVMCRRRREADRLVGVVGIHPVTYGGKKNEGLYFVTIFLDRDAVGKGIGTAALRQMLEEFWKLCDEPVYSDVAEDNEASAALMLKVGFVEEKKGTKIRGKPYRRFRADRDESSAP